ncbi:MAG TPA: hypothetical protein PK329_07795 [Myxococcota bacterium]|jgi:hypothetical protein|nr:hypothetical protein [Myxococcota bacterium]HHW95951.1 hypothetical protein [Oligoflexales bacterium]HOE82848.1 hypothetical protein [Myxococcota bacterium]HON24579.1 hypothetical protein [Myxococcota bacterium]HOS60829.1 hypothetical protein [Myxococcota bacterium]
MKIKIRSGFLGLVVLMAFAGCGGGGAKKDPGGAIDLDSVEVPDLGDASDVVKPDDLSDAVDTDDENRDVSEVDAEEPDLNEPDDSASGDADSGEDVECVPYCGPEDDPYECEDDGCGNLCGICQYPKVLCSRERKCVEYCKPECDGKECGTDGCTGYCGECQSNEVCNDEFKCVLKDCKPECDDKECGPDKCGGNCGHCGEGEICNTAFECTEDLNCHDITAAGQCIGNQLLYCQNAQLVREDCDAIPGMVCTYSHAGQTHLCTYPEVCQPQCEEKQCGDDRCGGSCGTCPDEQVCSTVGVCGPPCGDVTERGACLYHDTTLVYCSQGILLEIDCSAYRLYCKYDPTMHGNEGGYDCLP